MSKLNDFMKILFSPEWLEVSESMEVNGKKHLDTMYRSFIREHKPFILEF